ncbi:MAG: hypothetical protein WC624_06255 [Candidatus Margulisiibacteriota bacterium]
MKRLILLLVLLALSGFALASLRDIPYKEKYETNEFSIKFLPAYPLVIGETASINLQSPLNVQNIEVHLPDNSKVQLKKEGDLWAGSFVVSEQFEEGWQPLYIYIRHKVPVGYKTLIDQLFQAFSGKTEVRYKSALLARRIWIRSFKPLSPEKPITKLSYKKGITAEAYPSQEGFAVEFYPTSEAVSPEVSPIIIKGTRIFSFSSKSIEGTQEGFLPGNSREESLRLNVAGKISDTDINANFFQTSVIGSTQVASREEKVSILLKRGSTEAYFGDFTADLTDTEFSRLDKVLSGVKLSGDYEKFGFKALASNPQGQSKTVKIYGNGSQGPYPLGFQTVINSEHAYVDGLEQKRGTDFDIDYEAGTITFKNKTIIKTQIIEIDFDYRTTVYQHATYALRTTAKPNPNLNLGVTWIDDSDLKNGAESIYNTATVEAPQGHYILGADGQINLGDLLFAQGELAYSEKNLNILASNPDKAIGRAGKLDAASQLGPFGIKANYKRIGPQFEAASVALPIQDLTESGGLLTFKPNDLILSSAGFDNKKFNQAGTAFNNQSRIGKLMLTPKGLPSLSCVLDELQESNDPVPPYLPIDRLTSKNSWELLHNIGKLNLSAKTGVERRINHAPSIEVTTYKTTNLGASASSLDMFTAAANVEFKDTELPAGINPYTKTYNLNLSANPNQHYMAALSLNYIDDSVDGKTNVTDLAYKAAPADKFNTDGKLTVTSVKETFGSTDESVTKNVGSFKLELRPTSALRMRYYFKPNFTVLNRTNNKSYNNETQQYELNYIPLSSLMLGGSLTTNRSMSVDKTDYPNYLRLGQSLDDFSYIYTLKAAPLNFMSVELNYLLDDSSGLNILSPASVESYQRSNTVGREFNATIKTSLSERFSIDTGYSNKITKTGSGDASDNNSNAQTLTESLKCQFSLNDFWTFSASVAYAKTTDLLFTPYLETYTLSPGVGFIFRYYDRLRIDGDYTISRSYSGAITKTTALNLRGKYDLSEYVHVTGLFNQKTSIAPDFKTTELSGYVEINL